MQWAAFILAALGFAYLPGPAMLYTAAQTLGRGRRAGWLAVMGVHMGCYVHVIAAALGLALLFAAIPPAYIAMKVIGGLYLLWMGLRLWQQGIRAHGDEVPLATTKRVLRDSFLVEVLNPKTALFLSRSCLNSYSPRALCQWPGSCSGSVSPPMCCSLLRISWWCYWPARCVIGCKNPMAPLGLFSA